MKKRLRMNYCTGAQENTIYRPDAAISTAAVIAPSPVKDNKARAKQLLAAIRNSNTGDRVEAALEALMEFTNALDLKSPRGKEAMEQLIQQNTVGLVFMRLSRWYHSQVISSIALFICANLIFFVRGHDILDDLVQTGGVDTILAVCEKHSTNLPGGNSARLDIFYNSLWMLDKIADSEHADIRKQATTEKCADLVMEVMAKCPNDSAINKLACGYMQSISIIGDKKNYLCKKGAVSLVAKVFEKYRRENQAVHAIAKETLVTIFSAH